MAMEVPEALALVREHVGLTYRLYGAGRVDDALTAITAAREQLHQVARAHAAVHAWPDASYFDLACEVCFTFGYLLLHTGRQDEAIGLYEEGHTAAFEGGLELREAEALGYLAPLMAGAGEHATAGEMLQRAATIVDQADVKPEVAAEPHINLADHYQAQSDHVLAEHHARLAIRTLGDAEAARTTAARAHLALAHVLTAAGRLDEAGPEYDSAVALLDAELAELRIRYDKGSPPVEMLRSTALRGRGGCHLGRGDAQQAIADTDRALEITKRLLPDSPDTATALHNAAAVHREGGDSTGASALADEAGRMLQAADARSGAHVLNLVLRGWLAEEAGDRDGAIDLLERAIELAERLRDGAGGASAKLGVFEGMQEAHQSLMAAYFRRGSTGDAATAFLVAERSRARGLLDMLVAADVPAMAESGWERNSLEEEKALRLRLGQLVAEGAGQVERRNAEDALDRHRAGMQRESPELAGVSGFEALGIEALKARIGARTLVLEYDATGEETFVWAIRDDASEMLRLQASEQELAGLVAQAVGGYMEGRTTDAAALAAHVDLARILLGALPARFWSGAENLLIVPDGPLHNLPFELLPAPEGGLIADAVAVGYAPSATVWAALGERPRRPPGVPFAGLADPVSERWPALAGGRLEVQEAAELFGPGSIVLTDEGATEWRLRRAVADAQRVHIAAHGIYDEDDPLASGLVLSAPAPDEPADEGLDEVLRVHDMLGLHLNADVVVCSACDSGRGTIRQGEGLLSMARALLFAGARALVLTRWPVSDLVTPHVMGSFYESLADGDPVAVALRRAQQAVRGHQPDARYWAAFMPIGQVF